MEKEFQFLIYRSADEDVSVNALIQEETIWLTQKSMADLFATSKQNISYHLNNCFSEGELEKKSVVKEILTTVDDRKNYRKSHIGIC